MQVELEKTIIFAKGDVPSYKEDLKFPNPIPGLTNGPVLADVTFRNEFNSINIDQASKKLGAAAEGGEKKKNKQYAQACRANGWEFIPLAFDRMGYARPNVEKLANYLIGERAFYIGMPFAESAQQFWQDLAFAIHRTNARNVLQRYRNIAYARVQ